MASARSKLGLRVFSASILYSILLNFLVMSNRTFNEHYYASGLKITTLIEFFLFSFFFYKILKHKRLIATMGLIVGSYILYEIFTSTPSSYNPVPTVISFLVLLVYCILYFFGTLKVLNQTQLGTTFWVVVAIIIYCAGNFFSVMFADNYSGMSETEYDFIHDSLYILKNIILVVAIFSKDPETKT